MSANPWTFAGEPVATSGTGASITLVEGTSFLIATENATSSPGGRRTLLRGHPLRVNVAAATRRRGATEPRTAL